VASAAKSSGLHFECDGDRPRIHGIACAMARPERNVIMMRKLFAAPTAKLPPNAPRLRFLDQRVLDAATVFSDDVAPRALEPSTLEHPRVVDDMRRGYD
jgi:hypothetical protein